MRYNIIEITRYRTHVKVSIFYPNEEGCKFDIDYYLNTHMPMSIDRFGEALKGVTIDYGLDIEVSGTKLTYVAMAHLLFDSAETFIEAFTPSC